MVVPHSVIGRARRKALEACIGAGVLLVRPEILQHDGRADRSGHLGIAIAAGGRAGIVGLDDVAQADEEVQYQGIHGLHGGKPFGRVAADVLPGQVAAPGKRHGLRL